MQRQTHPLTITTSPAQITTTSPAINRHRYKSPQQQQQPYPGISFQLVFLLQFFVALELHLPLDLPFLLLPLELFLQRRHFRLQKRRRRPQSGKLLTLRRQHFLQTGRLVLGEEEEEEGEKRGGGRGKRRKRRRFGRRGKKRRKRKEEEE